MGTGAAKTLRRLILSRYNPDTGETQEIKVLMPFHDCLYEDPVSEFAGLDALKRGYFEISFHKYISPFAAMERALTGSVRNFRVTVRAENFPLIIHPYHLSHDGTWEGLEQDIKDDIAYLNSLGIPNIKYLGYKGEL